ncbi:MAG: hypothetical protein IJO45_02770 [Oscillospiraceae bacterium]|nr:hypothetical protein [Oscillospiraceae bacterium]
MNMKKIIALLLALVMLCGVLSACGGEETPADDAAAATPGYKVKVVDAFGNPVTSGVIVRFMQGGQQVSMQVVNEEGIAAKELESGEYTVELQFTDDDAAYYYDQTDLTMKSSDEMLEITLYNAISGEGQMLMGYSPATDGNKDHTAYHVGVGGTYVELEPGERNYFLFAPTEAGMYAFSAENTDAVIGYYGAPHFVQQMTMIEPVDGVITESIKASMIGNNGTGTTVMVLGLDAAESTSAILKIERIGDPEWTVEDEPWQVYQATHTMAPYTLPAGTTFGEFDLKASTDTYNLVLDDSGFYHLDSTDGPLVLVRLGEKSGGSRYLDSFETILEHSGVTKYFYDENGEFVKKESYSECLLEYIKCVDEESGVYPLTEDLKYIIQMRGDHYGWFDPQSPGYIFLDENQNQVMGLNHEITWLFMCCYING